MPPRQEIEAGINTAQPARKSQQADAIVAADEVVNAITAAQIAARAKTLGGFTPSPSWVGPRRGGADVVRHAFASTTAFTNARSANLAIFRPDRSRTFVCFEVAQEVRNRPMPLVAESARRVTFAIGHCSFPA